MTSEEHLPAGLAEYHHAEADPDCPRCGAILLRERHLPSCPERARIFFTLDARLHRAEVALQEATTGAFVYWIVAGGRT